MRRLLLALLMLAASAAQALAAPPIRVISPGGIEAWLIEDHANPILSLEMAWRDSGAAYDARGKEGLARLMAATLDEGAGPYDSQAFQRRLEDLSIKLSFNAGMDMMQGSLITLSRHRAQAFEMLRLSLVQPRFDQDAILRIKGQILAGLARSSEDPQTMVSRGWYAAAFPAHPYGRVSDGTPDSIAALTRKDLVAATQRLGRANLILGVVGDITPAELAPLLDSTFSPLPAQPVTHPLPSADVGIPAQGIKPLVLKKAIPQSVVQFGLAGVKRDDPDWFPAYVLNYILGGGGFSSRLMMEIREKRGLAYSAYSYLHPYDHAGIWVGGVATRNDKVAQSIRLVRKELSRLNAQGVSAEELRDAKTYLTGSFPLRYDSSANIAGLLVAVQADHLGIDYLDRRNELVMKVTKADVARVAKRLFKPENLIVVIAGDPKGL
ncbi:MAG: insulinase family protein [Alphaproteobacteria bacterium]|nr:insulinase family protein [Alphaproteobacteria bacterium]